MNFRNLLLVAAILFFQTANAQVTRVQIINNCADLGLPGIDVYIDGQLVADDVFFRSSTAFTDIPTGTQLRLNITENTAFDTNSAFFNTFITLSPTNKYVIVANGIRSGSGYSPQTPFGIDIFTMAEESAGQAGNTDVIFHNGSTDGPAFDARTGVTKMTSQLGYGQFGTGYTPLAGSGNINIRFTNDRGNITTHNFEGDFSNMGMTNSAVTVLTSGFVNTSANSNGPAFGLWAASPNGGPLQELTATTTKEKLARIQFIHNSADTGVGSVDVFLNNEKKLSALDYHVASTYMDIFAGSGIPLTVNHPGQTAFYNTNVNIDSGKTYVAVIHGLKSDTNYKPLQTFMVSLFANAKEDAANASNTDVLVMHGATDAPIIDINEGANNMVTDLNYGAFGSGYTSFPSATTDVYQVDSGSSNAVLAKYDANYSNWNATGLTATVVTSGFIVPDSNSGGPAFGLWAATANGGNMIQLPVNTSVKDIPQKAAALQLWPNPTTGMLSFEKTAVKVDLVITDVTGKVIASKNDYKQNTIDVSMLANGNYYLIVTDGKQKSLAHFIKQ